MNIAVFGMGIIGSVWSSNLQADGHRVLRWNRTPKPVADYVSSAHDAAERSELLIIVVADPAAVQSVLDQILPVLKASHVVVQSSTVSPEASTSFAAQVERTGAAFLEAPFTGSKPAAEQRKTVFFIGGAPEVMERARPVLQPLCAAMEYIGTIGSASALKLAMNVNVALVVEALCESLSLARAAGISDERYFSILKLNTSHTKLADLKKEKLEKNDFTPQFSIKHMAKDLKLALGTAESLNLPQTSALLGLYERGISRGWAEDDFVSLVRLLTKE